MLRASVVLLGLSTSRHSLSARAPAPASVRRRRQAAQTANRCGWVLISAPRCGILVAQSTAGYHQSPDREVVVRRERYCERWQPTTVAQLIPAMVSFVHWLRYNRTSASADSIQLLSLPPPSTLPECRQGLPALACIVDRSVSTGEGRRGRSTRVLTTYRGLRSLGRASLLEAREPTPRRKGLGRQ